MDGDQLKELRQFLLTCKFLSKRDRMFIRGLLQRFEIDREASATNQAAEHVNLEVDLAMLSARFEAEKAIAAMEAERHQNAHQVELMNAAEVPVTVPEGEKPGRPPSTEWRLKRMKAVGASDPVYIEKMQRYIEACRLHTMIDKLSWALSRRASLLDAIIRRER